MTALEPCDELADLLLIAYENSDTGSLEVVRNTFEEFESRHRFDLVAAANSFHWIDPAVSYRKTAEILRPGGRACLFWYFPILADKDLQQQLNSIVRELEFEDLVREPVDYGESLLQGLAEGRNELDETGHIQSLDWVLEPQRIRYSIAAYRDLLRTYVSSKDPTELLDRLQRSIFRGVSSIELIVYEYVCIAARP